MEGDVLIPSLLCPVDVNVPNESLFVSIILSALSGFYTGNP